MILNRPCRVEPTKTHASQYFPLYVYPRWVLTLILGWFVVKRKDNGEMNFSTVYHMMERYGEIKRFTVLSDEECSQLSISSGARFQFTRLSRTENINKVCYFSSFRCF